MWFIGRPNMQRLVHDALELIREHTASNTHSSTGEVQVHDANYNAARRQLRDMLTTLNKDIPALNAIMDRILKAENALPGRVVDARSMPHIRGVGGGKLALWRGDICRLRVDAIVNAANAAMLGRLRANHPVRIALDCQLRLCPFPPTVRASTPRPLQCIDNAIHSGAGPRLRQACREIMRIQGHAEEAGAAKVRCRVVSCRVRVASRRVASCRVVLYSDLTRRCYRLRPGFAYHASSLYTQWGRFLADGYSRRCSPSVTRHVST